jgi:uncharacterized protein involved in outer membrane biogenesis
MKKAKKIFWFLTIGVVVLLIVAVVIVAVFLDGIVKTGVETVGPKITGVSITLDEVHIGLLTGSAKVKSLVIGNPAGYTAPSAVNVGLAEVGVNPFSVLSSKIVVRTIHVEAPEITFEGNPLTGNNNISKIMDNLNDASKSAAAAPATNNAAAKPAKKIEVDDFLISDAKVHFNGLTLPLPPIHLTDLGTGPDGITATDLSKQVFSELTKAIIKAVASSATDLGKGAENIGKDAGKAAGNTVNTLTKGIGGLFGK